MTNGEKLRPYCMVGMALLMLRNALTTDYAPALWIAAPSALFFAASAGWFFRDVRAKQARP